VPELIRAHVFVTGMVQGVFFRHRAREEARARDVSGWVRNLPDGRVEAVFEGPEGAVEALVSWCRTGPEWARVDDVEVAREEPQGLERFEVRG
jgi:acylphosphatase